MKTYITALLILVASAGQAYAADSIVLGADTLAIDTVFHANVGPGTTQTSLHLSGAMPLDVFYTTTDISTDGVSIRVVCPGGKLAGTSTVADMARTSSNDSLDYFAGVNGDFYLMRGTDSEGKSIAGTPVCATAVDGEVYKSSEDVFQFSVDEDGILRICRLSWSNGSARSGGRTAPFKAINNKAVNNAVTLYTSRGPENIDVDGLASVPVDYVGGDQWNFVLKVGAGNYGMLVGKGSAADFVAGLQPGDSICMEQVVTIPDGQRIKPVQIVSGRPKIVENGANMNSGKNGGFTAVRHPRTAIGMSRDGKTLIMMVVDGRGLSVGVTTEMLADLMLRAGAWEALNLDGGGSSTMYTSVAGVRNWPSDGRERKVGNGVFVVFEK